MGGALAILGLVPDEMVDLLCQQGAMEDDEQVVEGQLESQCL
jgi:hypothetical protein